MEILKSIALSLFEEAIEMQEVREDENYRKRRCSIYMVAKEEIEGVDDMLRFNVCPWLSH